jgi:hypothetical protein
MKVMRLAAIIVLVLHALPLAAGEPILRQNFANSSGRWSSLGNDSAIQTADSTLLFTYTARPSVLSLAYLPVAALPFAEFRSLSFELRTDISMPVAVLLSEKKPGGGNYSAVVWSTGTEWQRVILGVSDFAASDGANDPVDSDHKLDPDQVETLAILDLGQFFSTLAAGGNVPFHVQPHDGPHTISIRGFEISRDPLPPAAAGEEGRGGVVDDFRRPIPAWFTPGGAAFEQHPGEQNGGTLSIHYRQLRDEFIAFQRQLPARDYRGATHLAMDVASDRPAQLMISIAERRIDSKPAARYNADFFVPGGGKPDHRELALSAFDRDENGPADPDGKLDPQNIQSITILDISGESAENTLTLHDLRLVRR